MAQRGEHRSTIGVTGELPLHDQMPNLSPQCLILHWIGQVGEAKSLHILRAYTALRLYELTSGQHRARM